MMKQWWWLIVALISSAVAPGCCCELGPDRLTQVEIEHERGPRHLVAFDGRVNELSVNAYFRASRVGDPEAGRLTTIPLLELYDTKGLQIALQRFAAIQEDGCPGTAAEIYEPYENQLIVGDSYTLVHRGSASPGDIHDSIEEGFIDGDVTEFEGEPALVATIYAAEPFQPAGSAGAGGALGTAGGGGAAGGG